MDTLSAIEKSVLEKISLSKTVSELSKIEESFLGRKGQITAMFAKIGSIDPEKRAEYGKSLNEIKNILVDAFEKKKIELRNEELEKDILNNKIDPTAPFDINSAIRPGSLRKNGTFHPLFAAIDKMCEILVSMGYIIEDHRILDDDWHVFESLNIPKGHPARDMWDTFWTDEGFIPTTHTSNMQVRVMSKYKYLLDKGEPIAVAVPGKCHRNEATDATHEHTFYQLEMVYVSESASIADMIGTMKVFLERYFEKDDIKVAVQPSYFPFVEPGLQFMNECVFCNGVGCPICKYSGWIEIMGCGYIHPKVLENAGINSDKYSGFAYGPGVGRIVMLKNGISDIRHLAGGDLRFLEQF